ncbi:MAG TPA: DUF72 domain-containing protein [Dehalococcoidia bacterium]
MADGRILIGTCSWSDKSLLDSGKFYPPEAATPEGRLRYYARHFPIVEVDSSYYAIPAQRTAALWTERTPDGFVFDVKAFRLFTGHPTGADALPRDLRGALPQKQRLYYRDVPAEARDALWEQFTSALVPLASAGKLGVVLLQFPPWFRPGRESEAHLEECRARLADRRVAVEFRHAAWLAPERRQRTLAMLRDLRAAYVCVDEPQGFPSSVPPVAAVTSDVAVVRFHGRNARTWEARGLASSAERFDYVYSDAELDEWVPRLRALAEEAREVHALMNTNYQDQGVVNARRLQLRLFGDGAAD